LVIGKQAEERLQKRRWAEEEAGAVVARVTGKCNMWYNV